MKLRNKVTGDTGYLEIESNDEEKYRGLRVYKNDILYVRYNSLAELNAEWEDYVPKEPLIDEKEIREIIRLCSNLSLSDTVSVRHYNGYSMFYFNDDLVVRIPWELAIVTHIKEGKHTLTELCGK